jgi:1,4-dihydroxy-2-naphthoate octaprenyltransferase
LNPAIYLISLLPGMVVLMHAASASLGAVLAATAAVVLLQHAINVLNDVADWNLGADAEKWDSWVRVHGETRAALVHGVLSFAAGAALGLTALIAAHKLWILGVAAPLVTLGFLYNAGPRPLSYTFFGEWVTGICYGGVFACLWLLTENPFGISAVAGSLAFAALAVSLLLSHQPPQIATDKAAGKHSFAVRYGAGTTFRVSRGLFVAALAMLGICLLSARAGVLPTAVFGIGAAFAIYNVWRRAPSPRAILLQGAMAIGLGVTALVLVSLIS